jgi:hypothetical protein
MVQRIRSLDSARVLALAGTTASLCACAGGWLGALAPQLGSVLVGAGGFTMLVGNLVVLSRS